MRNEANLFTFGVLCIIFLKVCIIDRGPIVESVHQCFHRDQIICFLSFFTDIFQLFDVCTVHVLQFIIQTNKSTTYIYINMYLSTVIYTTKVPLHFSIHPHHLQRALYFYFVKVNDCKTSIRLPANDVGCIEICNSTFVT
jgi:uncharacterized membrane protein